MKWRVAGASGAATAAVAAVTIPAATSAAVPALCAAEALDLSTRERPSDLPGQSRLEVVLTNISAQNCAVHGFPGVDLAGPEDPTFGATYRLPRQAADPAPLTVEPGAAVSSLLTYLPGGPDGWVPVTLIVTPPDTTTRLQAPWPAGVSVQRQDGATHPGTFIGPLQPA
ncbi:DUF4232 domain-containing protein [Nocardia zapadnayensis]|uniref:DUF4232 domain-containing protein n=1 Tax=Nocardia rhamnosiphila TaxID=426716 RepID=UPI002246909A|nr:DUF4232 domain-containing protein [Nocardia zapadnayensis]MCX0273175.1 DUF4232 domain-containing protein [Nocardia zapadnayensis]